MTIHLDTSALVGALTDPRRSFDQLCTFVEEGHRVGFSTIVLYEWLRGPRTVTELRAQEDLFPSAAAIPFDAETARRAAALYSTVSHPRNRPADLAIAACALVHDAALWTLNPKDFSDVPDLKLM